MAEIEFASITMYDWVPFFKEVTDFLVTIGNGPNRDETLMSLSKACFGEKSKICKYEKVDPFSFIYFLAQRNTSNQRSPIYQKVKTGCYVRCAVPTDWIFPSPTSNSLTLFHHGKNFKHDMIWDIFLKVKSNKKISDDDFKELIAIPTVKTRKITQTLFLTDPLGFLPIDDRISILFPDEKINTKIKIIENDGFSNYYSYISLIQQMFPECRFYEINLLCYLIQSSNLGVNNSYFQIGSNVFGETNKDEDHKEEFYQENKAWVGGPVSGGKGTITYKITVPRKGDVILSHFNKYGNGIGVVVDNEYARLGGFHEDRGIKVIWINKAERIALESTQSLGFSKASAIKTSFENAYPESFELLKILRKWSEKMHNTDDVMNLIIEGPPGTGKTRLAKQLAQYLQIEGNTIQNFLADTTIRESPIFKEDVKIEEDQDNIKIVQFHPGYSYEDFIRGIVTEIDGDGRLQYREKNKILAEMAISAYEDQNRKYILIIDEINRAYLPAVLGELIYALEYRDEPVSSPYNNPNSADNESTIIIPSNLYIIGTMNTADRSIGRVDYAIRRRFIFHSIKSDIEVIKDEKSKVLFRKVKDLISDNISADFHVEDVMVGHSYFLPQKNRSLQHRFEWEIKPLLMEYLKDGILVGNGVEESIQGLPNE